MLVAFPLVALVSATCPSAAAAAARTAYQSFDYPGTLAAVADVELCADGTGDELAEAFRWRAQAYAAQRNTEAAVEAFTWVATVSPVYVLDAMVAPKVHALFNQGRARVKEGKSAFARVTSRRGEQLTLEVFDPMNAVTSVRVAWVGGSTSATRATGAEWTAAIPRDTTAVKLRIDRSELAQWTSGKTPIPAAVLVPQEAQPIEPAVVAAQRSPSSIKVWPWAVGAGAVVLIAVAVGLGVSASNARFNGTLGRQELPAPR